MDKTTAWPDTVDEILGGDQVVGLAYVTPAGGAVLNPVTNFALRDREAGTIAVNSSLGMWKKLERMLRNPRVAVAFHTREHSLSHRPEYVLVQGTASFPTDAHPGAWLEEMGDNWERFGGQPRAVGPLWERWMSAYHARVNVQIAVERVVVWPDLACRGEPQVHGAPLPDTPPAPQRAPKGGTESRIDHVRAARRTARLPHVLLGWVGADGFPVMVAVEVRGDDRRGIVLEVPEGAVPPGGRRAGLAAHWFARYTFGQHQRKHTGWLEAEPGAREVVYAPHTETGYRFPDSRLIYRIGSGFVTWRGLRQARRAGFWGAA